VGDLVKMHGTGDCWQSCKELAMIDQREGN